MMPMTGLLDRVWRRLRRLFGPRHRVRRRQFDIHPERLPRKFLAELCADGDFAATVFRPDVTVKEVIA